MGRRNSIVRNAVIWYVALYIRLSKETKKNDDSDSVVNQRTLLTQALQKLEERFPEERFELVDFYIDDGETGTDSDREDFQRLLNDIKIHKINMVIFKDLSRLGRNYSEAGYYLDQFFVKYDCRYVSLNNPYIDSKLTPDVANSPLVPIQNVFNDDFARTTSLKVREVFQSKKEDGQFIGAFAPYGYTKDPKNKNAFIIDEEAASVVRDIYRWFVEDGMSKRGIALKLNEQGVPNPAAYKRQSGLNYKNPQTVKATVDSPNELWVSRTVYNILLNQMYIGNMVQGKQKVKSYKVHDRVSMPETDWTIVEGTHQPIIDKGLFEKAQGLHQRDTRTANDKNEVHMFAGFIKCDDCKKAMRRSKGKNTTYWFCRSFYDKKICSKRSISHDKLEGAILAAIQLQIALVENMTEVVSEINKAPILFGKSSRIVKLLKTRRQELQQCRTMKTELYIDLKKKLIDQDEYSALRMRFENEERSLVEAIERLEIEQQAFTEGVKSDDPYLEIFLKHKNIRTLSRDLLTDLVNNVYVDENSEVIIEFNYKDQYEKIAEFIDTNKYLLDASNGESSLA